MIHNVLNLQVFNDFDSSLKLILRYFDSFNVL